MRLTRRLNTLARFIRLHFFTLSISCGNAAMSANGNMDAIRIFNDNLRRSYPVERMISNIPS